MYTYLLPGSEFHDKIRDSVPTIDDTVQLVVFEYYHNVYDKVSNLSQIVVDSNNSGSILASITESGTTLYVYSDSDIRCKDCQMMFYRMSQLKRVDLSNFNTDECTSMRRMFMNCASLEFVDMSHLSSWVVADFTEMFSGCTSCKCVDVRRFVLPSEAETCVYSDMFKNNTSLRSISVGSQFTFFDSMSLENPSTESVTESNGKWNNPDTGQSFDSSELPSNTSATYYAVDLLDESNIQGLVTLPSVVSATQQIARTVLRNLRYLNAE